MDHIIKTLDEDQLKKLVKKDHNILIELQKEIHTQKNDSYEKLKNFYWTTSIAFVVGVSVGVVRIEMPNIKYIMLGILLSFIGTLVGGKIYLIDKPKVVKKAIAKSKLLDAMEIETTSIKETRKGLVGLILAIIGSLIYLILFIIMIIG